MSSRVTRGEDLQTLIKFIHDIQMQYGENKIHIIFGGDLKIGKSCKHEFTN